MTTCAAFPRKPFSLLLLACWALALPPSLRAGEATVHEERMSFRSYPFTDPDPVARMGSIYPYFRFQGYTSTPQEREWTIVTLENPYIRVLIAPEVGGKVLGAIERSTGREFLYLNHVMKFRDVALRGPWTSGGIEFNFGVLGHTPTTATPVDYLTRTNADGSVSCIVGALDLPSRTEWRVEIRLPADRALFETRSFWYNPTEQSSSLYHWMNAGVAADSTLQVFYPGTAYITHEGEPHPWPIDTAGRDLSYYRNNNFGSYKSYHVLGTFTDFFGACWGGEFGVVHWAPYVDKPGKKLWIWGLSREGEIWVDLLTDTDLGNTQYVELQSGIHFNQALPQSSATPFKNMEFLPSSSLSFTEAWYPFRGLQGLTRATAELALDARRSGSALVLALCPTGRLHDTLEVVSDRATRYARLLDLRPLQVFTDTIPLESAAAPFEVRIGGRPEYRSSDDRELERPLEPPPAFDRESAYGHLVQAQERERQRDYDGALLEYRSSLERNPEYLPSLTAVAGLLYRRMEYQEARDVARRALALDAYDPEANFAYGLVQRQMNRPDDARDGFGLAARSRTYRSAALIQLAEMALLEGSSTEASAAAGRAFAEESTSVPACRLLAVLARLQGDRALAETRCERLLALDPLNHLARYERFRLDGSDQSRAAFTGLVRNELPHETYLELAAFYLRLGLLADASELLTLAPEQPMVNIWRAYVAQHLGRAEESSMFLKRALRADPTLVFPHRRESLQILRWAAHQAPDWKLDYYQALLLWHLGRADEARQLLDRAGSTPEFAPLYLARASLSAGSPDDALAAYRRAVEVGPDEWRTHHGLVTFLNSRGEFQEALRVSAQAARRFPAHTPTQFLHARTLMLTGQYRQCLALLDTLRILPAEGARDGRDVYHQACLLAALERMRSGEPADATALLARARLWPEHLGSGRPYDPDTRAEDYLEALIREERGDAAGRDSLLTAVVAFTRREALRSSPQHLLGAAALRRLGREDDGRAILQQWREREPQNAASEYCLMVFTRQTERAGNLEMSLRASLLHRSTGNQELVLMNDFITAGLLP